MPDAGRGTTPGGVCPAYADGQHRVGPYLHVDTGTRYTGCVCQDAPVSAPARKATT